MIASSAAGRRVEPVSTMSKQAFLLLMQLFTGLGILFAIFTGSLSAGWDLDAWNGWAVFGFFVGVLVVAIIGIVLYTASDVPIISALGYALVAGPMGLMCGPYVAQHTDNIAKVAGITIVMTIVLGLVGVALPDRLDGMFFNILFIGLIGLIAGYFIVPLLALFGVDPHGGMTLLDIAGVIIFGGFIVYDLNKAKQGPFTLDRAIDCAAGLFVDIVNFFLHILGLNSND